MFTVPTTISPEKSLTGFFRVAKQVVYWFTAANQVVYWLKGNFSEKFLSVSIVNLQSNALKVGKYFFVKI